MMHRVIGILLALALLCSTTTVAQTPGVGNGPGSVQAQPCIGTTPAGGLCTNAGAPANNCVIGALAINTSGSAGTILYSCTATNTWTAFGSGASCTGGTNINITSTCTINLTTPLTTSLIAGPGTPSCATVGELCSAISTSSGQLLLGGSSSNCGISYGVHHVSMDLNSGACNTDIGDGSTALMRFNCASSVCTINVSNDAVNANEPLSINGFGAAQGSTLTLNFASTIVKGPLQAAATSSSATTYVAPVYNHSGTAVASTMHCVTDTVTAGGASTSVTLTAPAAFAAANYFLSVWNVTGLASATVTAQSSTGFTFTSTNANVYYYNACGP